MRRPSRMRSWLKWCGVITSLLIVLAWTASLRWDCGYAADRASHGDRFGVYIAASCLGLFYMPSEPQLPRGWIVRPANSVVLARQLRWKPEYVNARGLTFLDVPLWIPFLLVAIPTAYLCWRDRRRIPPGHCRKCGYNLTGNVSGVCPECGVKIADRAFEKK
jgi:hypothetical protein